MDRALKWMHCSLLSLLLVSPGCNLPETTTPTAIREAASPPIRWTSHAEDAAEAPARVVNRDAENPEDSTAADHPLEGIRGEDSRPSEETAILVDAEEALRVYQENILLVGEALLTLELMERGALEESKRRIDLLTESFPEKESAILVRTLLNHWLSRTRTVSGQHPSHPEQTASPRRVPVTLKVGDRESTEKAVASLKREGLNFYSRGNLSGAVSCWRRILELDPDDGETRQFLQRAEAILKNRRAGV